MRKWLWKEGLLTHWTEKAVAQLKIAFPNNQHENRSTWRSYLVHAQYALASGLINKCEKDSIDLARKVQMCLHSDGRWKEAQELETRKRLLERVKPFVQPNLLVHFATQISRMKVEGIVVRKLRAWLSDEPESLSRLWFYGLKSSTVSAILFNTAKKRRRPVVAYPCRLINYEGRRITEEELLVGLVYSFIYQLLQQLRPEPALTAWTSSEKCDRLDGTFLTLSDAVILIKSLVMIMPKGVYIIDGLQYLGHTENAKIREILSSLVEVFQGQGKNSGRLFVTSSGPNDFLAGFDDNFLGRFNISKHVDSGTFVLSKELLGVPRETN
jgi:hypothetical protein